MWSIIIIHRFHICEFTYLLRSPSGAFVVICRGVQRSTVIFVVYLVPRLFAFGGFLLVISLFGMAPNEVLKRCLLFLRAGMLCASQTKYVD